MSVLATLLLLGAGARAAEAQTTLLRDGFESGTRCSWSPAASATSGLTAEQAAAMLARHNEVRAGVSPPAVPALECLEWSAEVAAIAQAWASGCSCGHNSGRHEQWWQKGGSGYLGENIAWGGGTPTSVVTAWASEADDYDYASATCTTGDWRCLHYTQIVWRGTTAVGCGRASCSCGTFWVCNYAPAGNVGSGRPY